MKKIGRLTIGAVVLSLVAASAGVALATAGSANASLPNTPYQVNVCTGSGSAGPYSYGIGGGTCMNGFRGTSPSGSNGIDIIFNTAVDMTADLVGFNHAGECLQVAEPFEAELIPNGLTVSGNGSAFGTVCATQSGLSNSTFATISLFQQTELLLQPVGGNPSAQRTGIQGMAVGDPVPNSGGSGGTPAPTISVNGGPSDGAEYDAGSTPPALNYSCANADTCTATDENGNQIGSGGQPPTGPGTHTITYTASGAGGTTTQTVTYTVPFPPTITVNSSPAQGGVYEFKTTFPPTLSWSCANATSCTATDENGNGLGQGATVSGARGDHTITFAASGPGGSTSQVVHFTVVDTIHPAVTITTPIDGKLYVQNRDNVPATFSCTDLELATCTAVDANGNTVAQGQQLASVYGRNFKLIVTGLDLAGNSTTETVTYSVDAPPTAHIDVPLANDKLFQGENLPAAYGCADIDGTVTSCVGNVPVGAATPADTVGNKTFSVTATDNDNVSTTVSTNYRVVPVIASCRGTAVSLTGVLNLALADANPKTSPCATDSHQIIGGSIVLTPAIPLLHVLANSITIGAITGTTAFTPAAPAGEADAGAQIANVTLSLLGQTINLTGVTSQASSALTRCTSPATLTGTSWTTSLTENGSPLIAAHTTAHNLTVPLLGIGALILNQQVVSGNSITENAVHLSVAGLVDLTIGSSTASASCGS